MVPAAGSVLCCFPFCCIEALTVVSLWCFVQAVQWECDEVTKKACFSKGKSKVRRRRGRMVTAAMSRGCV